MPQFSDAEALLTHLRSDRLALAIADLVTDFAKSVARILCQAAIAQTQGADQGTVNQQVGIAPDRRGEVSVCGQR